MLQTGHKKQGAKTDRSVYSESSMISQYLGMKKGLYEPQCIHKKNPVMNFSPNQTSVKMTKFKVLAKNYYQTKYLLLTDGTQEQRQGWRKCLIDNFKLKIDQFIQDNQRPKGQQHRVINHQRLQIPGNHQFQNHYALVNEIVRKSIPNLNIEEVQENLIKSNAHLLRQNSKHIYIIKQFEEIVNNIETEAFKMRIPSNFSPAMSNYNDFYDVERIRKPKNITKTVTINRMSRTLKKSVNVFDLLPEEDECAIFPSSDNTRDKRLQASQIDTVIETRQPQFLQVPVRQNKKAKSLVFDYQKKIKLLNIKAKDWIDKILQFDNVYDENLDLILHRTDDPFRNTDYIFIDNEEEKVYETSMRWIRLLPQSDGVLY